MPMSYDVVWKSYWSRSEQSLSQRLLERTLRKIDFTAMTCSGAVKRGRQLMEWCWWRPRPVVVEAGCGEAQMTQALKAAHPEWSFVVIDICEDALVKVEMDDRMVGVLADILDMPLGDSCCDLCCNVGTVEHFKNPVAVIREMARVSRYAILCAVPAKGMLWRLAGLVRRMVMRDSTLWTQRTFFRSVDEWVSIFEQAGLKTVKSERQRLFGFPFMDIVVGWK